MGAISAQEDILRLAALLAALSSRFTAAAVPVAERGVTPSVFLGAPRGDRFTAYLPRPGSAQRRRRKLARRLRGGRRG